MPYSDRILDRLLSLHPKAIDLSLDRMWRILDTLGHPELRLPPVIHVAGTNGKGSVISFLQAMLEAAGKSVHIYTSPHLVRFHERIRLGRPGGCAPIAEDALSALLEECEEANGGDPITFFEITTAAALLAFARQPADYLLLEVGLGGRLDATNVVAKPALGVITGIDYDHQSYLGDTLEAIALEKAGILKRGTPAIVGPQHYEARGAIESVARRVGAPLIIAEEDWQVYEQHGRLVFLDEHGLLDLPMPKLFGRFQIENAGIAIAAIRKLADPSVQEKEIEAGLATATWPARLERLSGGALNRLLPDGSELWLDGGHNPAASRALAIALAEIEDRAPKPLILIWGMLNTKDPGGFVRPFAGLANRVIAVTIEGEGNALSAEALAEIARASSIDAETAVSLEHALVRAGQAGNRMGEAPRVLITGSLYLAGRALALQSGAAELNP